MGLQNLSLVDRKKLQWQREKDEMAKLERYYSHSAQHLESANNTNIDITKTYRDQVNYQKQLPNEKQLKNFANMNQEQQMKHRSPSLPPIHNFSYGTSRTVNQLHEDSGFTSDGEGHPSSGSSGENLSNGHCIRSIQGRKHQPRQQQQQQQHLQRQQSTPPQQRSSNLNLNTGVVATMETDLGHETDFSVSKSFGRTYTPESMSAMSMTSYANSMNTRTREERAKWNIYDSVYKDMKKDGPNWLDKCRDIDTDSIDSYSFLRGQNVPIDPSVLAERETKRKKAMELQSAIKEQLEERERIKQIEREKQIIEERIEEQRLMRQFEDEQHRREIEQQAQRAKLENERKKDEVMRRAIEKAAMEAKLEKERRRGRSGSSLSVDYTDLPPLQKPSPEPEKQESDGEKVLIGTPIKLKQKDLKVKRSPNLSDQTEESEEDSSIASQPKPTPTISPVRDDGITLPVQSLIPIMPVQFANFGFPQANNLQLVMVTQPSFSSPFAMYQNFQNFGVANSITSISPQSQTNTEKPEPEPKIIIEKRPDTASSNENVCNHCNKNHYSVTPAKIEEVKEDDETPTVLPHDGTFTKETLPDESKLDAATSTGEELSLVPRTASSHKALMIMNDIGVQTDMECDLCLTHCSSSVVTKKERQRYMIERTRSEEETTTTTTTTTIVKKEKRYDNLQDRPKWGVRVPAVQYLKASERDPFRNRRKRFTKKNNELSCKLIDESSSSEAPRSPRNSKSHHPSITRNMCTTELLPIKTDGNGKVYFVREKSFIINEALRGNNHALQGIMKEKILSKRLSDDNKLASNDFDSISLHSSIDYTN